MFSSKKKIVPVFIGMKEHGTWFGSMDEQVWRFIAQRNKRLYVRLLASQTILASFWSFHRVCWLYGKHRISPTSSFKPIYLVKIIQNGDSASLYWYDIGWLNSRGPNSWCKTLQVFSQQHCEDNRCVIKAAWRTRMMSCSLSVSSNTPVCRSKETSC